MPNIDELSIQIEASTKNAQDAIDGLTKGLENLNRELGQLDVSKVSTFANAMTKLANIGASTSTTSKALKEMASEITSAFGIHTKKGIEDVTLALQTLYTASRNMQLNDSPENNNVFWRSTSKLQEAIEANYKYKESVDSTTKSIAEYIRQQNKSGSKVAMADMAEEFGENFKNISKVLGKSFRNKLTSTQGAQDLAEFFTDMNDAIHTTFKTDTMADLAQSVEDLVIILENAKDKTYDFGEALSAGMLDGSEAAEATYNVIDRLFALIEEQDKYGASSGLSSIAEVFKQISNIQMPDLSGVADESKSAATAKAISNIGDAAEKSASQVENLASMIAQSYQVIEGNEIKEHGFTMKDAPEYQNVEYPPMVVEQAQAYEEKLLPAIVDTQSAVDALYQRMMSMSSVEAVYDAITQKFIEMKTQLMEMNGAISGDKWIVPEFTGNADFNRQQVGWISNIQPEVVEGYFYEIEDAAEKCLPAIQDIGTTALVTADQIRTISDALPQEENWTVQQAEGFRQVAEEATDAGEAAEQAQERMSGRHASADVIENLVALGEAFEKLGSKLNAVGDKGIKLFQTLMTPLKMAVNEYKEKFDHMAEIVSGFQKSFKIHMDKIAQFWKRTMKTFTFMLVRKAITAIIKEVGNAVQSLAMYSNMMGTAFNTDISNMVADFQYLGRSIVSVFAPLINTIAPIIDAIVAKIATLLSYIGMLIAALGGSTSFTKAKKNVGNYAESLDKASKSAKNLTMGIDELNIISENSGGGSSKPYDGFEDAWEDVDIPNNIKDLADKLKGMWEDFISPIKEAWDRAKQYVIDGWKTMIDSLSRLGGHIWDDFIKVWSDEKTIRMLEQIFRMVGDIERVIRNLANGFDNAWQKGKTGLAILTNLRDIAAILVDHIRNVTYYMIQWAEKLDFTKLLESFKNLTESLKKVADFIGGVFEDAMIDGVLKYIKFLIEKGVPHLQNTIADVIRHFNFNALRQKLKKLWGAFEELFENIHEGTTDAIGNLGNMVARFTSSKTFTDFLQRLVDISKLITAERVEKVLTGIGKGILILAESVIKFINSDIFMKFLEVIADWIDNHSVDQIAQILVDIANAILIFKFGAFVAEKLAGFFQFFTLIKAMTNLSSIAAGITNLGTSLGVAGEGAGAAAASGSKLVGLSGGLGTLVTIVGSLVTGFLEFKGVSDSVESLVKVLNGGEGSLGWAIAEITTSIGLATLAFSLLLGFPGGLIASGCVAAVAAIKGIHDAVAEINFDRVGDAILTQGEMTVTQVKQWYDDTTEVVEGSIQRWKDAERNLTQDRKDIEEYGNTITQLSEIFTEKGEITASMADKLAGKYEDLQKAIGNYIDQSTDSLVANLLAQKGFLEAQGIDVDQMIIDIYRSADEEKKAIDEAVSGVREAVSGLDELTEGTEAFNAQMQKVHDECNKASGAVEDYAKIIGEIKTDEAVAEISKLGDSLNLSQYLDDPDGWEGAIADISGHVEEVKETYLRKVGELESEAQSLKNEIDLYPKWTDAQKEAGKLAIEHDLDEAKSLLANKSAEVLDLYSNELTKKMGDVATKAGSDWDEGLVKTFLQPYTNKEEYIINQMQTYTDTMVEKGLQENLKEAYAALPGDLENDVVGAMQEIVDSQDAAYQGALLDESGRFYEGNFDLMTNVLNAVNDLDYDSPAQIYADDMYSSFIAKVGELNPEELGNLWGAISSQGIFDSQQEFEDALSLVAGDGSSVFSNTYAENLQNKLDEIDVHKLGYKPGEDWTQGFIDGAASKEEETQMFVENFFMLLDNYVHDNKTAPFGSPNLKMIEYGQDFVYGFNKGIDEARTTTQTPIETWFASIKGVVTNQLRDVKTLFDEKLQAMLGGEGLDVTTSIGTLFTNITTAITTNLELLGTTLLSTTLPGFVENYIKPFFAPEIWQPVFDGFYTDVLEAQYQVFLEWWDENITLWWNEHLINPWFTVDKWDTDIYTPLGENLKQHWDNFIQWWDQSIKDWWDNHNVKKYFTKTKWDSDIFTPLKNNIQTHWKNFITWWDKSIKDWWDNHLIKPWFTTVKWDNDVFTPLKENIQNHWQNFITWWDQSIKDWWENRVKPYFTKELWLEQFNHVYEAAKETFEKIKDEITKRINEAATAVQDACRHMCDALQEVLDLIDEVLSKMSDFGDFEGSVTFDFGEKFAMGGFPKGDIFLANEAGPELVGTIGGRTAVASNNEITGIADAVYETGSQEMALLGQLITLSRRMLDKDPVVIGDREIARMANNGQNQLGMSIIT